MATWIVGTAGSDSLFGTSGEDLIWGLEANDSLYGNGGNDFLDGGTGADAMAGGTGDDAYVVDNVGDVVFELGGQGTDEVRSYITYTLPTAVENLVLFGSSAIDGYGNNLNNEIDGNSNVNYLSGGDGNDSLDGQGGADILIGGSGNDTLIGGAGADAMAGGTGDDVYYVDNAGDVAIEWGSEGTDAVYSSINWTLAVGVENLILTGSAISGTGNGAANHITGNSLNNVLVGGGGNDTLNGAAGADDMYGGDGDDTYWVDNALDEVFEIGSEFTIDVVRTTVTYTVPVNIDRMYLIGSAPINGYGNDADNWIVGNSNNNTLTGGIGHDKLDGGGGADVMIGGIGGDIYTVDNSGDVVTELDEDGNDSVGALINYTLGANIERLFLYGVATQGTGNELDNEIYGHDTDETLSGLDGDDIVDGQQGIDTMIGGAGDDLYRVMNLDDAIVENAGEGHDTVHIWASYTMDANVEDLFMQGFGFLNLSANGNILDNYMEGNGGLNTLDGGGGNDELHGGGNDDIVFGGVDDDTLFGEHGNDVLAGGLGVDVMYGGIGADRYYFADASESGAGGAAADQIMDFSAADADKIDLSALDADITTAGHQLFTFIGNENAFFGVAQVRFNGGFVEGDIDGDLNADFRIQLNAPSLVEADFIL
jgi:Ca2+-binding RTX toxin-like protein